MSSRLKLLLTTESIRLNSHYKTSHLSQHDDVRQFNQPLGYQVCTNCISTVHRSSVFMCVESKVTQHHSSS